MYKKIINGNNPAEGGEDMKCPRCNNENIVQIQGSRNIHPNATAGPDSSESVRTKSFLCTDCGLVFESLTEQDIEKYNRIKSGT